VNLRKDHSHIGPRNEGGVVDGALETRKWR
jgi:hypothetical protein